jgi:hypothetical protein
LSNDRCEYTADGHIFLHLIFIDSAIRDNLLF